MRTLFLCLLAAGCLMAADAYAGSAQCSVADAFDFPVGKPEAEGYYKARGYRANGHLGEDWNGRAGGDSDLGDPVYAIGNGVVVLAVDYKLGWGNVVIVRHAYRESGELKFIDSLYGHLDKFLVSQGQQVTRGQQLGTIGDAHGKYPAHLHFEIRKDLRIGMQRSSFARDLTAYFDPTSFLKAHRTIAGDAGQTLIALDTFQYPQTPGVAGPGNRTQVVSTSSSGTNARDPNIRQRISAKRNYFQVERYGDLLN